RDGLWKRLQRGRVSGGGGDQLPARTLRLARRRDRLHQPSDGGGILGPDPRKLSCFGVEHQNDVQTPPRPRRESTIGGKPNPLHTGGRLQHPGRVVAAISGGIAARTARLRLEYGDGAAAKSINLAPTGA